MEEQAAAAEWLPPGWTVEIRVRKSGKKDWTYTDPSKEHKFNSKPEVLRYLKSKDNIPESCGKRRSSRNHPSSDSPAVVKQVNSANNGTNGQKTNNQRLERRDTLKDEKIVKPFAGVEETSVLNQKEKKKSVNNGECDLVIVPEAPQNIPEVGKSGNNNKKSNNKDKKAGLPCRASKRLAGVDVGPIPELSPNSRTRRVSARRVNDTDVGTAKSLFDNTKATGNEDGRHDCPSDEGSKEQDLPIECGNNKSGDMAGVSIEVPMQDLWNDPCIEFAIKTLTGQIPIEEVLIKNKVPTEVVPKPSTESAFSDLWADPCIEFAVKTLTGDIPFNDSSFQNYFQSSNQRL